VVERLLNPKDARYPSHNPRRLKPKNKNPVSEKGIGFTCEANAGKHDAVDLTDRELVSRT